MLSLTIEEVERHLHVRAAFLRALEAGEHCGGITLNGADAWNIFSNYATFGSSMLTVAFCCALQTGLQCGTVSGIRKN